MEELKLNFTGKGFIILEMDGLGPMQFKWTDKDLTLEIVRLILDYCGNISDVSVFSDEELKQFNQNLQ